DHFLVRRKERLPDADGVINNFGYSRVPIAPLSVEENPVSTHHEVLRVAPSERRYNLHLFAGAFAEAIAVGKIGSRQAGHRSMLRGVLYEQAKVTAPLVEKKRSGQENGLPLSAIEILE